MRAARLEAEAAFCWRSGEGAGASAQLIDAGPTDRIHSLVRASVDGGARLAAGGLTRISSTVLLFLAGVQRLHAGIRGRGVRTCCANPYVRGRSRGCHAGDGE